MDDLKAAVNEVLLAYGLQVDDTTQTAIDTVSKEAVKRLKLVSKQNGWNKYATGWKYDKRPGKNNRGAVIYNGKYGSLTHLLENGHVKVLWGRSTGERVAGRPHIADVDAFVSEELPKEIEKLLNKL